MRRLLVLLIALSALGWGRSAAVAETRVALVVGNSAYQSTTPLANPLNDARDMSAALKSVGFDVVEALDADKRKLDGALRAFTDKLANADVALFFYAGHGLQVGLQNYLVPVDARLDRERDLEFETVKLEFVLRQMEIDREGKTTIVILDACRDNPMSRNLARTMGTRSTSIGRGLAAASTGLGTFIAYSTQPGNVALDGQGRNSPFTAAVVKHMGVKGHNLPATMIEVRKDVVAATDGKQVPWDHSALTGDFFFVPGAASAPPGTVAPAPAGTAADVAALQERLRKLEEEAKRREAALASAAPPTTSAIPPVMPRAGGNKEAAGFQVEDNVRIDGLKYSDERQPSPAACREACEQDAHCVAFQHGRRSPVMGQCQLFSRIDARQEDATWRSGVRAGAAPPAEASAHAAPRKLSVRIGAPLTRKERGFDIYEGIAIMGEQLKMSATDSSAGCQAVCRNTPGCAAATYNDFFRGKNVACMVYRDVTSTVRAPTSTLMIRSD
jgi:uncharacterized caspase-like protein